MTTPGYVRSGSPLTKIGLAPATIPARLMLSFDVSHGGSSFNSGTSSTLGVLGDLGLLGFLAYCALLGSLFIRLRHETSPEGVAAASGFAMSMILGLVYDWWEQPPFGVLLACLAGLPYRSRKPDCVSRTSNTFSWRILHPTNSSCSRMPASPVKAQAAAGWAWARMLAGMFETWIVTRRNNRTAIERALQDMTEHERARLHFVYVDLPPWAMRWKHGQRGVRLYYLCWQVVALRAARALHAVERFDWSWHLTLANAWLGSVAPLVGPPFVYGPVGGGARTPIGLLPTLGARGIAQEAVRTCGQFVGRYANPLARLAWRRSHVILVQNEQTRNWFPKRYRMKCEVFQHAVLESEPESPVETSERGHTAIFAGRLIPWKGGAFAVEAIALPPNWQLLICGDGPDRDRIARHAGRHGLNHRVHWLGWLP